MIRLFMSMFLMFLLVLLGNMVFFVVDQRFYTLVFSFGELKQVIAEPGLYMKFPPPFNTIRSYDKRIWTLDTPDLDRFITAEKKNIVVDSFVKWRVTDPKLYYVSVGGREKDAEVRLQQSLKDSLNNEIGKRTVYQMISGEREQVMRSVSVKLNEDAQKIGITVVDVRLKRVEFSDQIRDSVFSRMESERKRVANELRSTGSAESEKIRADADRQREILLAEAYRDAQRIKGEGDAKSSAIYAQAFSANPEFYSFYRSMEAYRQSFRGRSDMLVIDPSSEFFRYLRSSGGGGAVDKKP